MQPPLFEPIKLRELTLPNRIVVSPMCMNMAKCGLAQAFHHRHVGALAESGAGLVIMEATGVEPIGRIGFGCLGLWSDAHEETLTALVQDVRSYSATPLGIQLGHAGRKASNDPLHAGEVQVLPEHGGWVTVGPTDEAFGSGWSTPLALEREGLERIVRAFANAAARAVRCGFDLVEVHGAHGYLIQSFLSPLTNTRNDEYGGDDLDNRMRFPLEVIGAIRSALPSRVPMGVRMNGEEWIEGGFTLDEAVIYASRLKGLGVDYITLSSGGIAPGIRKPPPEPGYMVYMSDRVRRESDVATMTVGGIVDPRLANAIVENGQADLVAIGRAMLDDPRWGVHAAMLLGAQIDMPPTQKRVHPSRWPFYSAARSLG